ncbi:unnamed protein product [Chrysoparadoxa australica]
MSFARSLGEHTERLVVDTTLKHKLHINMNLTFHSINCLDLHIDAMDVAGDNQFDLEHNMVKQRLDATGGTIGNVMSEQVSVQETMAVLPDDYCGNCYGADGPGKSRCCNTCQDVLDGYSDKGWQTHSIKLTAEQCVRERNLDIPLTEGEGCNLSGFLAVNKVAGNFHMAMGESLMRDGKHIHLFNIDEANTFNISHTIHHLSFGESYPGMNNPLDGAVRIVDEDAGTGLMQYFIQLVPTIYSGELVTSQFSYTMKFRSLYGHSDYHYHEDHREHHSTAGEVKGGGKEEHKKRGITQYLLPGVFFVYDVSPFMVEVSQRPSYLSHFLIRLCAIAGGAYRVSSMADGAVYYVMNHMKTRGLLPGSYCHTWSKP